MPLVVLTLVAAVLTGLWLPRPRAFAATGVLAVVTVAVFVWSVADGKGNDPWWIVLIALAASVVALGIVHALSRGRAERRASA
jgi:hypothetical protein